MIEDVQKVQERPQLRQLQLNDGGVDETCRTPTRNKVVVERMEVASTSKTRGVDETCRTPRRNKVVVERMEVASTSKTPVDTEKNVSVMKQ